MKRTLNTTVMVALLVLIIPAAALPATPRFPGEIWGGSEVLPQAGPVNVYWVFDGGAFYEYVYYFRTDEIRVLTSGQYTTSVTVDGKTIYTLQVVRQPRTAGAASRRDTPQLHTRRIELMRTNDRLVFPAGDQLFALDAFTQFVPPVEHGIRTITDLRVLRPKPELYASCCSDCFAVHDFLGISFLNGICCLGGCGSTDGGGFGGGGASGGW